MHVHRSWGAWSDGATWGATDISTGAERTVRGGGCLQSSEVERQSGRNAKVLYRNWDLRCTSFGSREVLKSWEGKRTLPRQEIEDISISQRDE